jgi:hypothetical protein
MANDNRREEVERYESSNRKLWEKNLRQHCYVATRETAEKNTGAFINSAIPEAEYPTFFVEIGAGSAPMVPFLAVYKLDRPQTLYLRDMQYQDPLLRCNTLISTYKKLAQQGLHVVDPKEFEEAISGPFGAFVRNSSFRDLDPSELGAIAIMERQLRDIFSAINLNIVLDSQPIDAPIAVPEEQKALMAMVSIVNYVPADAVYNVIQNVNPSLLLLVNDFGNLPQRMDPFASKESLIDRHPNAIPSYSDYWKKMNELEFNPAMAIYEKRDGYLPEFDNTTGEPKEDIKTSIAYLHHKTSYKGKTMVKTITAE